jgi:homoserine kinase
MVTIRVPCSTANLGPGFDALGLALDISMTAQLDDSAPVDAGHPAQVAFRTGGGKGPLSITTKIPPGKGLGYSGASCVVGFAAAAHQQNRTVDRDEIFAKAAALEGHPDNVAPSVYGGFVVTAAQRAISVPCSLDVNVLVWIPPGETATRSSRAALPSMVRFEDAVFNVGRASLMVAAMATGDIQALSDACADRLHQSARLANSPDSATTIETALDAGAISAWLSGSGPTVAIMVESGALDRVRSGLPDHGHSKILSIDTSGLSVTA